MANIVKRVRFQHGVAHPQVANGELLLSKKLVNVKENDAKSIA